MGDRIIRLIQLVTLAQPLVMTTGSGSLVVTNDRKIGPQCQSIKCISTSFDFSQF